MSSPTLLAIVALLSLLSFPAQLYASAFDPNSPYPYLTSASFVSIKNTPAERLVLFFHSSPTAPSTLTVLNTVARRLRAELPHFVFQFCNGSESVNVDEFSAAGFKNGEWLFTSTPIEGIVKYTGPVSVADIVDQVRHKYLPSNATDLVRFTTEDAFYELLDTPPALPILVKFFEPWCEHCKRLAPTFAISATYFRSSVRHIEVQCSGATDETDFCKRHGVQSYPVVMLFNGEQAVRYEGEERSVRAFDAFFEQHVSGYESRVKALRKEKRARKNGEKATAAEVEAEEPASNVAERAVKKSAVDQQQQHVVSARADKAEAVASREKQEQSGVGKQRQSKVAEQREPSLSEPIVAERLSALEREVSEIHNTLRAIQQQLTALVAQKR